jgi:hypothetical protein
VPWRKLSNLETVHLLIKILATKRIDPQRKVLWKVGYFNEYPGKKKPLEKKLSAVKRNDRTVKKVLHTQNDKEHYYTGRVKNLQSEGHT